MGPAIVGVMKTHDATLALHREASHVASSVLCSAIPAAEPGKHLPEWIQLLPGGGVIETNDGRGPYLLKDPEAVIAASAGTFPLPIDQDHATDLAARDGRPAPARGWITELQARDGGVWGKVEWTGEGGKLVADRAYRAISPAFLASKKTGEVLQILRASLVNNPNLRGLAALHQAEKTMDFMKKVREALGLSDETGEDAVLSALKEKLKGATAKKGDEKALQSALAPIATAVGLKDDADAAAVLAAVESLKTIGDGDVVKSLQSELTTVTTELNAIKEENAKTRATAFVDGAILAGHFGVKPIRDKYIAMHMKNPAETEDIINALPKVGGSLPTAPELQSEEDSEDAVTLAASATAYQKKLADSGQTIDIVSAVAAVKAGKHKE